MAYSNGRYTLHYTTKAGKEKYINFKSKSAAKVFVEKLQKQLLTPEETN